MEPRLHEQRDLPAQGTDVDTMPADLQLLEQRDHGEKVADGGRGVGKDGGHQGLRMKGSSISSRQWATWSRLSPASRRSSFQV